MSFLLDTMIVCEPIKTLPEAAVLDWLSKTPVTAGYVSVVTFGEIEKGIARLPTGPKQARLQQWAHVDLPRMYVGRVLGIDIAIARVWGRLDRLAGRTLPAADALLAATALHHDLTLATRNERDFASLSVRTHNPYQP